MDSGSRNISCVFLRIADHGHASQAPGRTQFNSPIDSISSSPPKVYFCFYSVHVVFVIVFKLQFQSSLSCLRSSNIKWQS